MSGRIRVLREADGRVVRVLLAAPKANILDAEMAAAIEEAVTGLAGEPELALVVFEGQGDHFSFGASVAEHRAGEVGRMLPAFHRMFRRLASVDIPLASQIRGQCLGGGLELAAFCDFVMAEEGAKLGLPEIRLGVFPPVGTALLPARIGVARAADWILTGTIHTAGEAHAAGLVTRLFPAGDLEAGFQAWLGETVLQHSASSLRVATRALRSVWQPGFFAGLDRLESLYLEDLMATGDAREGVEAFLAKRAPVWSHGKPA